MLTLNDGRKELYQWDTGRIAKVEVDCDVVHFSNLKYGESLAVEVKSGKVAIPNKLLTSGEQIYCWAFVQDESGAYTKKEQTFTVIKRAKPSDYVYTETEVITIKTAVEKALEEAKESGDFKGDKGDKGDRGEQGIQGKKGDDGYTPQKGVDYFTDEDVKSLNIPSVDQTYSPNSENAQSGKAVEEAVAPKADKTYVDDIVNELNNRFPSIKTVMDEVAVASTQYYLGEVTELNITLPEDTEIGEEITVSWYNGETASTLAIDGNMLDFDYIPSANTRSEINALWDGTYWSVIGMSQEVPSEVTV